MLVFAFCLLSCVYGLQNGQNTIPAVLNSVGVGYNILRGNPDGTDWRNGGEDPGLLVTRRILKLESEPGSVPNQLVYVRHDSCQSSATDRLIYSPKTYQDHLGHRVSFAGTLFPDLQASAFTLSTGYLSVKKETDTLHYVLQDRTSTCINGTARYTLNLVSANFYHLTDEFMSDVCSLPEVFDTDSYMHFLDRWGTSEADVTIGGPLYNRDSSWVVDLQTFKLRPSFPVIVGNSTYKLETGSKDSPEPVGLNLTSIDMTLTNDFWNDEQYSIGLCPNNITRTIAIRRQNLIKALQQYASQKGANIPPDSKLAMPIVWPSGMAGLPKPKDGCPEPTAKWVEGWLRHDTETQSPSNSWNATHLDATLTVSRHLLRFCIKPYTVDEFSTNWPAGDYCIFMYKHCPLGFSEGFVQWDDEDTNNENAHGGYLPDGSYGSDIRMKYCCRSDGEALHEVVLPTEKPFYLFQYKNGCQAVRGMTTSEEYILWDDEDSKTRTSAAIGAVHPGMNFCNDSPCGFTGSYIYYCYYKRNNQVPNIIG
ncbi:uncharacterized protein LOC123545505 isoform X2 [Mercenaria mercenaria]|uniref:uncharacterized protein LOC123545505 isoform X2 n=1 Tax=Mercenaria mercenaria TaxID=6596 RepID=UPI00234E7334|nr:uncharacterized protein LOC123545505 isoform X2 [Mercenaria mercenaria]